MSPAARQSGGPQLRASAEAAAAALPALILSAERLAASVQPGAHGLRQPGAGEDFWQYRPAAAGDTMRQIDWRRSGRSDSSFVREREAQTAQAAVLWVSAGQGMAWTGDPARPTKRDRARLLALALALVLLRGGEKVALAGETPRSGRAQGDLLAQQLLAQDAAARDDDLPAPQSLRPMRRMVLVGDFLGDIAPLNALLHHAAAQGVRGVLLQVLDPVEEGFPVRGVGALSDRRGGRTLSDAQRAGTARGLSGAAGGPARGADPRRRRRRVAVRHA